MKELELLKKNWNNTTSKINVTTDNIRKMIQKKSSSIVKKLFYISVAELIFWIAINFSFSSSNSYINNQQLMNHRSLISVLEIIGYIIITIFIYLLYKSYNTISCTDNIKVLMENIIKTRKVIKYYVMYNIITVIISFGIGLYIGLCNIEIPTTTDVDINTFNTIVLVIMLIVLIITVLITWFFYKLLYGFLISKLLKNYNELKKLDM